MRESTKAKEDPSAGTVNGHSFPISPHKEIRAGIAMVGRLASRGDLPSALDLVLRMLAIEPRNPELHFLHGGLLERQRNLAEAAAAYGRSHELSPLHTPSLVNRAACLADLGQPLAALDLYGRALAIAPRHGTANANAAQILLALRRPAAALPHLEVVAQESPTVLNFVELAMAADRAGDKNRAVEAYNEALKLSPIKAPIHVHLSTVELVRGNRAAALDQLRKALRNDPNDGHALLALARHFTGPDEIAERSAAVSRALEQTRGKPAEIAGAPLTFAAARLADRRGDIDEAFRLFKVANDLLAPSRPDMDRQIEDRAWAQSRSLTPDALQAHRLWGIETRQPVFVFGMPRSGTTLVEQMIASHPDAAALGEIDLVPVLEPMAAGASRDRFQQVARVYLDAYPEQARGRARVVDKSLSSWHHIGLIQLMFPDAVLINCQRHPVASTWSSYQEFFNRDASAFAYSFDRLARYYRFYHRLMRHWQAALPGRILDVRYEDLVGDPEGQVRRLLAHVGLEFRPECLDFHRGDRAVRTASMSQIRQPIYSDATDAWRRYAAHLEPLAGPLADLVADYEYRPEAA